MRSPLSPRALLTTAIACWAVAALALGAWGCSTCQCTQKATEQPIYLPHVVPPGEFFIGPLGEFPSWRRWKLPDGRYYDGCNYWTPLGNGAWGKTEMYCTMPGSRLLLEPALLPALGGGAPLLYAVPAPGGGWTGTVNN
jgi:hypothetical protein